MKVIVNEKEFELENATAYEALKAAELITREVIAAKVNGETCDLTTALSENDKVEPLTFADSEC